MPSIELQEKINWEQELVYNDGDQFFNTFEAAINAAQETIYVETYIFDLDPLGLKILELLSDAVRRGVKVLVLLDGVGSFAWTNDHANQFRKSGIQIEFFHPLWWQRPAFIFKVPNIRMTNHRDHRKLYLVDSKVAFMGSMNISGRHLKSISGTKAWRDTSVVLTGGPVSALTDSFWVSWTSASDNVWKPRKVLKRFFSTLRLPILLKHTLKQRRAYRELVISRIERTQKSIWITTPYFVPDHTVLKAITSAAKRGVDVQLLFPKVSDFFAVKFAMEGFYRKLLDAGVKIHEYLPSMLHAKIMMLDEFVSLGSSNLNHRSFFKDLEIDVILSKPETKKILRAQFQEDVTRSELRNLDEWNKRPIAYKLFEKIFYLFRGIL